MTAVESAFSWVATPPLNGDIDDIWERVLRPLGARLHELTDELGDYIVATIGPEVPELYPDGPARESAKLSARAAVRGFAEVLMSRGDPARTELSPEALAYVAEVVRRRLPTARFTRGARLGQAVMLDRILAELALLADSREELESASRICVQYALAYNDGTHGLRERAYVNEQRRLADVAAAIRGETIAAVLEGRELDASVGSARLGYELDREHVGICMWLDPDPRRENALELLDAAVEVVTELSGAADALIHHTGALDLTCWFAASSFDRDWAELLRSTADTLSELHVSVGEPAAGIEGFCYTHLQAVGARRVASIARKLPGKITFYRDVALQALVSADVVAARAFVAERLGALLTGDDSTGRIAFTLRVYLDENASRGRAAARLGVHENTVSYRIAQAERLLGRSISQDTVELHFALALADLVRTESNQL